MPHQTSQGKRFFVPVYGEKTPYTHPYSYDPFVIFKADGASNNTIYTDRLRQWDYEKYSELSKKHFGNDGQFWRDRDPQKIESFLQDWLGDEKVKLILIEEHCNVSTGCPLWRLDYFQ